MSTAEAPREPSYLHLSETQTAPPKSKPRSFFTPLATATSTPLKAPPKFKTPGGLLERKLNEIRDIDFEMVDLAGNVTEDLQLSRPTDETLLICDVFDLPTGVGRIAVKGRWSLADELESVTAFREIFDPGAIRVERDEFEGIVDQPLWLLKSVMKARRALQ